MLHRAAGSDEVWEGEMVPVRVAGRRLVLLRLDGCAHAYDDRCAHLGVPISDGTFHGDVLICSAHFYEYDARTGRGVNPTNVCLVAHPVEERDGDIFVEVTP